MLKHLIVGLSASLISMTAATAATAAAAEVAPQACDRACMTKMADALVASIVARRPQDVPLTEYYKATNSGVPASLPYMDLWRTISGSGQREYYIDTTSGQMFVMVSVSEGDVKSLLWGRLKVTGRKFSELELHLTRSRGDAGFIFGDGALYLPDNWTKPVKAKQIPSREKMLEIGRAMFSPAAMAANGAGRAAAIAGAKAFISARAMTLGEDAIQLHGGIGTTDELMVSQAFKRLLLLTSLLGDSDWETRRYLALTG